MAHEQVGSMTPPSEDLTWAAAQGHLRQDFSVETPSKKLVHFSDRFTNLNVKKEMSFAATLHEPAGPQKLAGCTTFIKTKRYLTFSLDVNLVV